MKAYNMSVERGAGSRRGRAAIGCLVTALASLGCLHAQPPPITFSPVASHFQIPGPVGVLTSAYPRLRVAAGLPGATDFTPGTGLSVVQSTPLAGTDAIGTYSGIRVLWQGQDAGKTRQITSSLPRRGRAGDGVPGAVFEQSFPDGLKGTGSGWWEEVSRSYPCFDRPDPMPAGVRWLSFTYEDWPFPLNGSGWPGWLSGDDWPAPNRDDGIRTPLVFCAPDGRTEILSPLGHPLQQLVTISPPAPISERPVPAILVGPEEEVQAEG